MIKEEITEQIKIFIHHILNKHKFYRLDMIHYKEFLFLLHQEFVQDPLQIQQRVFRGIVSFNKINKDKIGPVLMKPCFQSISIQSKMLIHKILHQYHFLSTIKAFQMLQQQNNNINLLNNPLLRNSLLNQAPIDDEFQKFRLNYMYYGSFAVFHIDKIFQTTNNSPMKISNQSMFTSHSFKNKYRADQNQDKKGNNHLFKIEKNQKLQQSFKIIKNQQNFEQIKKYKKNNKEKVSKITKQSIIQQQQNVQTYRLKNCLCMGKQTYQQPFLCKCGSYYHRQCIKRQHICLGCSMKQMDPFIKVKQVITSFYIKQWTNKSASNLFKTQKLMNLKEGEEIMISCCMIGKNGTCWPDDIIFKLNKTQIFAIPALLQEHPQKNRQDTSYFITDYFNNSDLINNNQIICSFEIIQQQNSQKNHHKRNNRNGTFFIQIYIVQQRTIKQLMEEIKNKFISDEMIHPLAKIQNNDDQMQIQSVSISCLDPYSRKILNIPVKGQNCSHYNCFDLQTYLTIMFCSQRRTWSCPICNKDARILYIEKYQEYILEKIRNLANPPDKVVYYNNGQQRMELGVQLPFQQSQQQKDE